MTPSEPRGHPASRIDLDDEAVAPLADRLSNKLAAISTDALRAQVAGAELRVLSPDVLAQLLGRLVRQARDRPRAATAVAAITRALARGDLDAELSAAALACARSRADRLVEALLAGGAALREYDQNQEQFIDRRMRALSLGERRALSRTRDIDQLVRLAHDQDPRVMQVLLQNPRLTEREAVLIASRRPTHAHVLEAVLASRFGTSRRVRRAVAHNPYSSVAQAVHALATLTVGELRLVVEDEHVAPEIRRHAASLSVGRQATPAERHRATKAEDLPEVTAWVERLESETGPGLEELEIVAIGADGRTIDS